MSAPAPVNIPAPAQEDSGVDLAHDLSPKSPVDRHRLTDLLNHRPVATELQEKGILKGAPNDALAGKKKELEKSMLEDRLEKEIAARPPPEELVKKGILDPNEAP